MSTVENKHKSYVKYNSIWKRCRDVVDGEVKAQAENYLPPLSGHDGPRSPEYLAYLARTNFYNATARSLDALTGAIFSKPPTFNVPPQLESIVSDVTLSGTSLGEFANQVTEHVLTTGRVGVIVDHTGRMENVTVAEKERQNLRPKLALYTAEQITNWRYGHVNGRYQLTLVVLREQHTQQTVDVFSVEDQVRYRVLRLDEGVYTQQVWELGNNGGFSVTAEIQPRLNGALFDYLPFFIFSPNNSDSVERPPISDLVDVNLAHYVTSADYESAVHFCASPTYFGSGFKLREGESIPIGSSSAYVRSESDAKLTIVEFTGQGLGALENNLKSKEAQMASLGARLLQESPRQVETAEAVNTKQAGENSVLASIAKSVGKGLTWLMSIVAEWEGAQADDVLIELCTDYTPDPVSAQTITALMGATQGGLLSRESFIYNLQRGGYLEEGRTLEDELADAEADDVPPPIALVPDVA